MANRISRNIEVLKRRFLELERRDRISLTGLGAFLSVLVLYYGIWNPANEFVESRRAERDRQLALIQYMRSSEQEARAASIAVSKSPSGQSLLTQVSRSAQQYNINPNRLQPEGDGVSVWFDAVAFNDLIRWLEAQSKQGVVIRQVAIDREDSPGIVNARIVLRG